MPGMTIHPNAPPRLIKAYRRAGSFHKLADEREVNIKYVHELITKGVEPTDHTEKGRDIRARLFLPRRKRKPGKPKAQRQPQPEHRRWWRKLGADGREHLIKQTYELNKDEP